MPGEGLRHPLLDALGIEHAFGTRGAWLPSDLVRPQQVHGMQVVLSTGDETGHDAQGDAIATAVAGRAIGIATADCVPILVATETGRAVAAIHAGWRGLAAGVIEAGVEALRSLAGSSQRLVAAVGPHIGLCCYEVDRPVLDAMTQRFTREEVAAACVETRQGHARIDLGQLSALALERSGIGAAERGQLEGACTACDAVRFDSYRRDGAAAGRLVHFVISR